MGILSGLLKPYADANCDHLPFTITLIDRGTLENDISTIKLSNWFTASHGPNKSNQIYSAKITGWRCLDICVGRGLGGTTNVNAGLVVSPVEDDFLI